MPSLAKGGKKKWTWSLALSQMEDPMMRLWDELLLIPTLLPPPHHHSWFTQTLEYCFFTSNPSIFLQLKNNENSEGVRDSGAIFLWTFTILAIDLVKCRDACMGDMGFLVMEFNSKFPEGRICVVLYLSHQTT